MYGSREVIRLAHKCWRASTDEANHIVAGSNYTGTSVYAAQNNLVEAIRKELRVPDSTTPVESQ